MRIAMVSTPFVSVPPRDYGGNELIVYELVEGLVECGHEVGLFATGDSSVRARLFYLYREAKLPPHCMADVNHAAWAMNEILDGDYDLIHAHSPVLLPFSRYAAEVPMFYTLHHSREQEYSVSEPDAPARVVHVRNPTLPEFLEELTISDLAIGGSKVSLQFQRYGRRTLQT